MSRGVSFDGQVDADQGRPWRCSGAVVGHRVDFFPSGPQRTSE